MDKSGVAAEVTKSLSPMLKNVEDKVMDKIEKARNAFIAEVAPLKGVKEEVVKTSQVIFSLTKAVKSNASQLEALSRTVEQLSGQLINEAKRNHQQQELLENIWKKVNSPQQDVAPAMATSAKPKIDLRSLREALVADGSLPNLLSISGASGRLPEYARAK